MRTTIDEAGRVVIPVEIRRRLRLAPGTPLEVEVDELGIRLVRAVPGPKLVRRGKLLVAVPTVPKDQRPRMDVPALIETERHRQPT